MVLRAQLSDTEMGVQFGAEDMVLVRMLWRVGDFGVVGLPERLFFRCTGFTSLHPGQVHIYISLI